MLLASAPALNPAPVPDAVVSEKVYGIVWVAPSVIETPPLPTTTVNGSPLAHLIVTAVGVPFTTPAVVPGVIVPKASDPFALALHCPTTAAETLIVGEIVA